MPAVEHEDQNVMHQMVLVPFTSSSFTSTLKTVEFSTELFTFFRSHKQSILHKRRIEMIEIQILFQEDFLANLHSKLANGRWLPKNERNFLNNFHVNVKKRLFVKFLHENQTDQS